MKIDHILFAVDFSAHSRSLNSDVEWLSSHFDSRVTLLHVFEIPTSWYGEGEIPLICSDDILAYSKSEKGLLDDYAIQIPENRVQRISVEGIAVERSPDALDQVRNAADLEIRIRSLDRESTILREVRSAILRIEDGSFGLCVICEDEIALRRLAAIPWTPLCIHCQQQAEYEHQMGAEWQELSFRAA